MEIVSTPTTPSARVAPEELNRPPLRRPSYLSLALSVVTVDERFDMRPLLVLGQLYFRAPLSLAKLRKLILERLCALPRFDSVVVDSGSKVRFKPMPVESLDMSYHVVEMPVDEAAPWTSTKLDTFLSSLNSPEHGLDTSRPMTTP